MRGAVAEHKGAEHHLGLSLLTQKQAEIKLLAFSSSSLL